MKLFSRVLWPDVDKLKKKKDIKRLIKALRYKRSAIVRQEAARALGELIDSKPVLEFSRTAFHWIFKTMWIQRNDAETKYFGPRWPERQFRQEFSDSLSEAIYALIDALQDKEISVRNSAAQALKITGDFRSVEPLTRFFSSEELVAVLQDKSLNILLRKEAAKVLGERHYNQAILPLIQALRENDNYNSYSIRESAATALGELSDPEAIEPLGQVIKEDKHISVQLAAVRSLGKMQEINAAEILIQALKNNDEEIRREAASVLSSFNSLRVINSLILSLRDEDYRVRDSAAFSLGNIGEVRTIELLLQRMRYENWETQRAIAQVFSEFGNPAIDQVIQTLRDEDKTVRDAAVNVLVDIGCTTVVPLIETLEDEDKNIREAAVRALGRIGDPQAMESLTQAICDQDDVVRREAVKATVNVAIVALDDDDPETVKKGTQVLLDIGEPAVKPLINSMSYVRKDVLEKVINILGEIRDPRAIEPLSEALRVESDNVLYEATLALAKMGHPDAIEPLVWALDLFSDIAVEGLRNIGNREAIEALIVALGMNAFWHEHCAEQAAKALVLIGEPAVEPLFQALQDDRYIESLVNDEDKISPIREKIVEILGLIGDTRAAGPLTEPLNDED
jgi:HEAT repeat protein